MNAMESHESECAQPDRMLKRTCMNTFEENNKDESREFYDG